MTLENATYISELVASNPVGNIDFYSTTDDHLQLIKGVLQAQFPNFTAAAMNATVAELNYLVGVSSLVQDQFDNMDHDTLVNFDADKHINWLISGAENIHSNRITAAVVTQHEGAIHHDNLLGFDSTEHIKWNNSGAEQINNARISASNITQHETFIKHNALDQYVVNEHLDHSTISISAGGFISGGGTITQTRTLNLTFSGEPELLAEPDFTDEIIVNDAGTAKRMAYGVLPGAYVNHSKTAASPGYTFDEHRVVECQGGSTFAMTFSAASAAAYKGPILIVNTSGATTPTVVGSGYTIRSIGSLNGIAPYGQARLVFDGTDVILAGDLV